MVLYISLNYRNKIYYYYYFKLYKLMKGAGCLKEVDSSMEGDYSREAILSNTAQRKSCHDYFVY